MRDPVAFENIAVSTRVRLARNFADYPFPHRLQDEEAAYEIIRILHTALERVEKFDLYEMRSLSPEKAELLIERNLISSDLLNHRAISAALVSRDERISVMINEEDHIREQYFLTGFDLRRAYERIAGIDDLISETIPFAYEEELGYLTACPTNLGTGLRASVMVFLPALARGDKMRRICPLLKRKGLTVRGAFGEGSGAEGDLYQISNEVTLGFSESEILAAVEEAVTYVSVEELKERAKMCIEGGVAFTDKILRSFGILSNCMTIDAAEFMRLMADVKLGVACGVLEGSMQLLDALLIDMRPANIDRLNGSALSERERDIYRAEYVGRALRGMELLTEEKRMTLSPRE